MKDPECAQRLTTLLDIYMYIMHVFSYPLFANDSVKREPVNYFDKCKEAKWFSMFKITPFLDIPIYSYEHVFLPAINLVMTKLSVSQWFIFTITERPRMF